MEHVVAVFDQRDKYIEGFRRKLDWLVITKQKAFYRINVERSELVELSGWLDHNTAFTNFQIFSSTSSTTSSLPNRILSRHSLDGRGKDAFRLRDAGVILVRLRKENQPSSGNAVANYNATVSGSWQVSESSLYSGEDFKTVVEGE